MRTACEESVYAQDDDDGNTGGFARVRRFGGRCQGLHQGRDRRRNRRPLCPSPRAGGCRGGVRGRALLRQAQGAAAGGGSRGGAAPGAGASLIGSSSPVSFTGGSGGAVPQAPGLRIGPTPPLKGLPDAHISCSPARHAGLVPASTAPQDLTPLILRSGGPRNKSGVTKKGDVRIS